ncbi:MAG: hypothetical protein GF421_02910 [Candidatus Aminicenantes bacterium]|nr:hypothetical protein [Candidatus Aminicenantes bacterium]
MRQHFLNQTIEISCAIVLILCLACVSNALDFDTFKKREIQALRIQSQITVDGHLNEVPWQSQGFTGFIQSEPLDGEPATEKTEVWVGYDGHHLYVAARLYDSEPENIITRLGRRDDELESDWFVFGVDPYFDKRSGFQFAVNPSGSIIDGTLFNDEGTDNTWDGVWSSSAHRDQKGWSVEIKIPYNQLRFRDKEKYTWGVNFIRVIKRKNEKAFFSWVPKEESGYVSRFAVLKGIHDIRPARLLDFLPFAVGKALMGPEEEGNPFQTGKEFTGNAGFDLKAGLKSNLTLNLTVNPDFGQVEVDPAVINISDQETYYEEKRPFFIEGADIFRFGTGGANTVRHIGWKNPSFFYSRRIGRSPQGYVQPFGYVDYPAWTTILTAAKVTGKVGKGWNVGFLSALTNREHANIRIDEERTKQEIEPFSYYGVLRAQKEFNQGNQGLGFIATSVLRNFKTPELAALIPRSAFSLALDGWTFLDKNKTWVVTGWIGGTMVTGTTEAITKLQLSPLHYFQRPDAHYVDVDKNASSLKGWSSRIFLNKQKGNWVFNTAVGFMSPEFNSMDLGYHTRGDVIHGHVETGYQTFHPDPVFRSWKITLAACRGTDFGGNRINENYILTAFGRFLNYWSAVFTMSYDPTRYNHYLTRGGPIAEYPWGFTRRLSIHSDNRKQIIGSLSAHYRTHPYGAYNWSLYAGLKWKPRSNLSLSLNPGYMWRHSAGQWVTKIEDDLKVETYGVRYVMSDIIVETIPVEIRVNWTFTPRLSLQAYLQPYIGVGDYFNFKEWKRPRTFDFDVYGEGDSTLSLEKGRYTFDPDGPGPAEPFSLRNPDFNLKSMRGTVVLRWEYSPGSTFFAVWTQNRADYSYPGQLDFSRDIQALFRAPGDHIFLIKINHRFKL